MPLAMPSWDAKVLSCAAESRVPRWYVFRCLRMIEVLTLFIYLYVRISFNYHSNAFYFLFRILLFDLLMKLLRVLLKLSLQIQRKENSVTTNG